MTEQQPGEYLEERLIGMLLVNPSRLKETLELKAEHFANPINWKVLAALHVVGNDIQAITEMVPEKGVGSYLVHLSANESFTPENIPAYVRAIKETAGQRDYRASVSKLSTKGETKLFGGV